MFVEGKVNEFTRDVKDQDRAQDIASKVRLTLMGLDPGIVDPSIPPSDEVINAMARGEKVDIPRPRRRYRDPASL